MKKIIPVMHCFDNNYVIPAIVAFYSMLENASKDYDYKLYVLHTDITEDNQNVLQQTVSCFDNASLEFINMGNRFDDLWKNLVTKGHYSKEMFYKFVPPSIFPQYDKIIISDVDVVWAGDISKSFVLFDADEDFYLAGHTGCMLKGSWIENSAKTYLNDWSAEEIKKLKTNACFWLFNLKKMRQDQMEQKFIDCAVKNISRIKQPEQDVVNLCCYPKIKEMPFYFCTCTYVYDLYKTEEDLNNDLIRTKEELTEAMESPVQLHFATAAKPWNNPFICTKSEEWFKVLAKTPFFNLWLKAYQEGLGKNDWINIFNIPFLSIMKKKNKFKLSFLGFKLLSWKK